KGAMHTSCPPGWDSTGKFDLSIIMRATAAYKPTTFKGEHARRAVNPSRVDAPPDAGVQTPGATEGSKKSMSNANGEFISLISWNPREKIKCGKGMHVVDGAKLADIYILVRPSHVVRSWSAYNRRHAPHLVEACIGCPNSWFCRG